ncbi:MAG TPA: TadE/TadG family type IV pilus assembly protein [Rhizomicrobium sp.]|nr:TadE/TadG family type IV pilus assembly protein [Rhizomicrobium sp.]
MRTLTARSLGLLMQARRDTSGVTAIEFAMIAPILIGIAIAVIDLGLGVYTDTQLANAAHSGASYAVQYSYDSNAMATAAQASTNLKNVNVTTAQFCGCPTDTGVTTASCGSTCSDGLTAGTFAQVTASKQYTTLLSYPGIPASINLSKQATVRTQ